MDKASQKILLVDDKQAILDDLAPFLERNSFQVRTATHGRAALKLVDSFQPNVIILDVIMPGINGREVLRRLRAAHNQTPIILLTVLDEPIDEALGLDEGADDYLSKPFSKLVLLARIRKVLQRPRHSTPTARQLISGELHVDLDAHRVLFREEELNLTGKAYVLLKYMMRHPGILLTYEALMDTLWSWQDTSGAGHQAIRTRIAELRHALYDDHNEPKYIQTVRGEGYRFIAPVR